MERDYAPLSAACVRALQDKIYEKRKAASSEVEKMVKDLWASNNKDLIRKLLVVLGKEFAGSQNLNQRRGGLMGIASTAIGLNKDCVEFMEEMLRPVTLCLNDADSRVRYAACETLYNVVKVVRGSILPHFNELFSILSRLIADPDQHVKNASELSDRLLKDIVTETPSFDLVAFIPLLRERIYSKNPFARQFIISWISVLDSVPDIDMLIFLPEFLDGLFLMLSDSSPEVKKMCDTLLGEFLHRILKTPEKVDFSAMTNILVTHADAKDELLRYTALVWLKEFVNLSGRQMVPSASNILTVVLPAISEASEQSLSVKTTASGLNDAVMALITAGDDVKGTKIELEGVSICEESKLDVSAIVHVLSKEIPSPRTETELACLRWFHHLLVTMPNQTFLHMSDIFPALLRALSDPEHEVVLVALKVIAKISSDPVGRKRPLSDVSFPNAPDWLPELIARSPNLSPYFACCVVELLRLDPQLLERRGSLIIRQLSMLLCAEHIFITVAEALQRHDNLEFVGMMVKTLNTILFTSPELADLRNRLKALRTPDDCQLFCCLYKCWCHCPAAAVALCLLSQNYLHAMRLIEHFLSKGSCIALHCEASFSNVKGSLGIPCQRMKLVSDLRLHLLHPKHSKVLVQTLYGILMLLPQSEAFHILRRRLDCLPGNKGLPHQIAGDTLGDQEEKVEQLVPIPVDDLLAVFLDVQRKRDEFAKMKKLQQMDEKLRLLSRKQLENDWDQLNEMRKVARTSFGPNRRDVVVSSGSCINVRSIGAHIFDEFNWPLCSIVNSATRRTRDSCYDGSKWLLLAILEILPKCNVDLKAWSGICTDFKTELRGYEVSASILDVFEMQLSKFNEVNRVLLEDFFSRSFGRNWNDSFPQKAQFLLDNLDALLVRDAFRETRIVPGFMFTAGNCTRECVEKVLRCVVIEFPDELSDVETQFAAFQPSMCEHSSFRRLLESMLNRGVLFLVTCTRMDESLLLLCEQSGVAVLHGCLDNELRDFCRVNSVVPADGFSEIEAKHVFDVDAVARVVVGCENFVRVETPRDPTGFKLHQFVVQCSRAARGNEIRIALRAGVACFLKSICEPGWIPCHGFFEAHLLRFLRLRDRRNCDWISDVMDSILHLLFDNSPKWKFAVGRGFLEFKCKLMKSLEEGRSEWFCGVEPLWLKFELMDRVVSVCEMMRNIEAVQKVQATLLWLPAAGAGSRQPAVSGSGREMESPSVPHGTPRCSGEIE
ncbi:unnamed protein product [Notodromas monacha]|uniref:Protein VAC14 homolog n=1 Tax=Notodromas monacha TaxID=399045 RepID=A0A7R9BJD5_9CRUS|nr:unnamed protein product [Notodromas monacha]CAG0916583.1 unnamed protein product [Notodromas monacha]